MNADPIKVLAIQLRQIEAQITHLTERAAERLFGIRELGLGDCSTIAARLDVARYAVQVAAIRAENLLDTNKKPLPACAHDKPPRVSPPRVGQWFRMPLYNGEHAEAVVTSCTIKDDGAVDMELRTKSGERLAGVWTLSEQLGLHGIPTPSDTGRALTEPRRGA